MNSFQAKGRKKLRTCILCLYSASIKHSRSTPISKTLKMLGKDSLKRSYSLEEILTEKHIQHILEKHFKDGKQREVIASKAEPAVEGLAGFLADHIRVVLVVKCGDKVETIRLFVKRIPVGNKPKADFIDENNYFRREKVILQLLEEMKGGEGGRPWCARALVQSDSLIVMPDLAAAGYASHPLLQPLGRRHALLAVTAIARFHAAFANYETNRTIHPSHPYDFYREFGHILTETTFQDTPWVRTGAKLTADLLHAFSAKFRNVSDLEEKLARLFVKACESLDVAESTLNVVVHKDLWTNNILYKYEDGEPTNALLIDYQCVRYGPPAFDLTSFLYLNTTRKFREENESQIFKHYFETFSADLKDTTKKRLDALGYDEEEFLSWCEKSRMFGAFEAIGIFPQVLMDAKSAQRVFDDPETFTAMVEQNRSGPVIAYAREHAAYRERNLEVSEEFVERYILTAP